MPKAPIIALLIGIIAGYWIGYKDAYRGEKAIGSRIGIALGRVQGDGFTAERLRNAQVIRDSIRAKSGLDAVGSADSASRVP